VAENEGSTIIGESITVTGNVSGDEDLTIRGRLEGSVSIAKTLVVEAGAAVKAEISARTCVISGVVVGNVTASESVEITREARMVGDISAPRVIIADGASFRGRVDMGEVDVEVAGEAPARATLRPALRAPSRATERPSLAARAEEGARPRVAPRPKDEQEGEQEEERAAPARPAAPPVPAALGAVKRKVVLRRK
jgi:cytoskeletal protein CcmA (bactofilin family)